MSNTVLTLSVAGMAPFNLNQVEQELRPVNQESVRRSVNGTLQDTSWNGWQKLDTVITGQGALPPAVGGLWPGMTVVVGCIVPLTEQLSGSTSKTLAKIPVAGSLYAVDGVGRAIGVSNLVGQTLTLNAFSGTATIIYRPSLTMRVVDWRLIAKEVSRGQSPQSPQSHWRLELSES
ncbi:MAG: hypothetical protein FJX22_00435 [Alphaproteobacteria bacterium]|nr:hypothetical protein [Alphaproteobacteria bacterium]